MSKRKKIEENINKEKMINRLRAFLTAALMIIIFYPPYLQGLYFENHVLPTQIFVFTIFIVFLVYKWIKNDYTFFRTAVEYVSLGFVIVYLISIFVAVHTRSAIIEWLKYCMYFAVFYMVSDLADNMKTKLLFLWTIVISALGVSIIGLDAALGSNIVKMLNKIFNMLGVKGDLFFGLFVGNRIHSTLQYPNALASYLMASFFIVIGLLLVYNKWWQKSILGAFAFILFITFMLTQSRGAQLLFPIAVILLFISTLKGNKINIVTHVIVLPIPAVVISLFISPYLSTDILNYKSLLLLFTGLFASMLISILIKFITSFLQKIDWKVYVAFICVFLILSAIGLKFAISASIPLKLSQNADEGNRWKQETRKYILEPGKEYLLSYKVESFMENDQPYALYISIYSQNDKGILFGEQTLIQEQRIKETNGLEEKTLTFRTPEDSRLILINFINYYSGTSVTLDDAFIVDAYTGEKIQKVMLKNKYNFDSLILRFQNIGLQQSLLSRTIFYKDGLNIFKDKWFLGAGGGAWNYLYRQYQSYNYASSQAHNYPLQLGIETGILGIFVLLYLIIIIFDTYLRYCKKINNYYDRERLEELNVTKSVIISTVFTSIIALFLHSIIDFDFSESSILLLFWQLIALLNREIIDNLGMGNGKLVNAKINLKNKYGIRQKGKSTVFVGIAISFITLYISSTLFIASSYAEQSFESLQKNDLETAISKMEKAITLDRYNEKYVIGYNPIPNRPDIKVGLADILFIKNEMLKEAQENGEDVSEYELNRFQKQFAKVASLLKNLEKKAKNNLSLTSDLASYCFKIGEIEKGINYLDSAISYFPFEPALWHSKINVHYQLMKEYFNKEDYEKAKEYLIKGLSVINEAKIINEKNMNPFTFSENTIDLLQKMKFMEDNWNTDEIYNINKVVHYSLLGLDMNMDQIPEQWMLGDNEQISTSIVDNSLLVDTDFGYIYSRYPIKFEKGKTYRIEIILEEPIDYIAYHIVGMSSNVIPFEYSGEKYISDLFIESEPAQNGNQLVVYFSADCKVQSILVIEKD